MPALTKIYSWYPLFFAPSPLTSQRVFTVTFSGTASRTPRRRHRGVLPTRRRRVYRFSLRREIENVRDPRDKYDRVYTDILYCLSTCIRVRSRDILLLLLFRKRYFPSAGRLNYMIFIYMNYYIGAGLKRAADREWERGRERERERERRPGARGTGSPGRSTVPVADSKSIYCEINSPRETARGGFLKSEEKKAKKKKNRFPAAYLRAVFVAKTQLDPGKVFRNSG